MRYIASICRLVSCLAAAARLVTDSGAYVTHDLCALIFAYCIDSATVRRARQKQVRASPVTTLACGKVVVGLGSRWKRSNFLRSGLELDGEGFSFAALLAVALTCTVCTLLTNFGSCHGCPETRDCHALFMVGTVRKHSLNAVASFAVDGGKRSPYFMQDTVRVQSLNHVRPKFRSN